MSLNEEAQRPVCTKCSHFYVTWEKKHPYGCRAYGFKGSVMPALTVKKSSGKECVLFKQKDVTAKFKSD